MKKRKENVFFKIFLIISITLILFTTGCGKESNSEKKSESITEYFQETKLTLPNGMWIISGLHETDDHQYLMVGQSDDKKGFLWESSDTTNWERILEMPEELQQSAVIEADFIDDEHIFCSVDYNGYQQNSNNSDIRYFIVSVKGTFEQSPIKLVEDSIVDIRVLGTIVYGRDSSGKIVAYDYNTGEKVVEFNKTKMFVNAFCIVGNNILAIGPGEVEQYDIKTGESVDIDETLKENLIDVSDKNDVQFKVKLAYDSENGKLYYVTMQGLYEYKYETKEFRLMLYGKTHDFANVNHRITALSIASYNSMYMGILTGVEKSDLYYYTLKPEGIKVKLNAAELVLYSLNRNTILQAIVSNYNASHDNIYIDYVYGMSGSDATTKQDAISKLNVELLAGKGPDIILLDGLSIDALVDKRFLSDVSEILDSDDLFTNIAEPYKTSNGIFGIPLYFKLMAIHGDKEVVQDISNFEKLVDNLEREKKKYPDVLILDKYDQSNYIDLIYNVYYKELFTENELDPKKLTIFYKQLERINGIADYDYTININESDEPALCDFSYLNIRSNRLTEEFLESNELRVSLSGLTCEGDLARLYSFGKNKGFEYNLFKRDGNIVYVPNMVLGVNVNAKHINEAKAFISNCLTVDSYLSHYSESEGFAINRNVLEENFDYTETQNQVYNSKNEIVTLKQNEITKDQRKDFYNMVKSLHQKEYINEVVKEIIMEQAENYVNGKETIEQCVNTAVEKVNLYQKE